MDRMESGLSQKEESDRAEGKEDSVPLMGRSSLSDTS